MKYRILAALSACLIFSGCGQVADDSSETDVVTSAEADIIETLESIETVTENTLFSGIEKSGELRFGNSPSSLNRCGLICRTQEFMISGGANGDMILRTDSSEKVLRKGVYPQYINISEDTVYYVDGSDNSICSVDLNGENYRQLADDSVLFFAMTDKGMVYLNDRNELLISTDESTRLISDKQGVWVDSYGEWLIYTEFQNGCAVMAYNTASGEHAALLDYGFYPTVHEDYLYYQEREQGNICRMNLMTGEKSEVLQKWGQQFCFIDDTLYFTDSNVIYKYDIDTGGGYSDVYRPDDNIVIDSIFVCDGELYLSEESVVFRIDTVTGEKSEIR